MASASEIFREFCDEYRKILELTVSIIVKTVKPRRLQQVGHVNKMVYIELLNLRQLGCLLAS
jgi:hypothetical protein